MVTGTGFINVLLVSCESLEEVEATAAIVSAASAGVAVAEEVFEAICPCSEPTLAVAVACRDGASIAGSGVTRDVTTSDG